jgi:hypothetical protein
MPKKGQRSPNMEVVLDYLHACGREGKTAAEIGEAVGLPTESVRSALRGMRGRDEVEFKQLASHGNKGRFVGGSEPVQVWYGKHGPTGSARTAALDLASALGLTADQMIPHVTSDRHLHISLFTAGGDDD